MKKGFTLLELIVVIIIIGILATLGFTQYTAIVEKGRSAEARAVLGTIRSASITYNAEYGTYPSSLSVLPVSAPTSCTSTHYFSYGGWAGYQGMCECSGAFTLRADRCTSGGKPPTATACSVFLCVDSGVFNQVQCGMTQCK